MNTRTPYETLNCVNLTIIWLWMETVHVMGVRGMIKCMFTRESNMGVKAVSTGIRPLLY